MIETVSCNLCGSWNHRPVYRKPDALFFPAEWFTVVECEQCGLGFVNPRPTAAVMGKYYPRAFYEYFERDRPAQQRRYATEANFLREITARPGPKRLLDIGCASGDFPRYMQGLGWDVEGVEIGENANPITDFRVYAQEFTAIPAPQSLYDAVTAWAVIEHVHDPKGYFEQAARVLARHGLFVFLVTNFDSISSRYLFQEDIPRHLYFFTEGTVRRYLEHAGLVLIRADFSDDVYGMEPVNWLHHYVRRLQGRCLTWQEYQDLPTLGRFLQERRLARGPLSMARYATSHPVSALDRLLLPFFAKLAMWRRRYGIATYVARKP